MEQNNFTQKTPRRGFLGILASGATALGLATLASPLHLNAQQEKAKPATSGQADPADVWFNKLKGKHRAVFDCTQPNDVFPFAWPRVFLITNAKTGTPESDCGVVVVLRHSAIAYAFEDRLWPKYNFADLFKAGEPLTAHKAADAATAAKTRNPFWKPKPDDFQIPGFGSVAIGINDLQASGVMICVCDAAITVYSAVAAGQMKMDAAEVRKDWVAGLLPGIQPVPSGVWACGRAQEHGCQYIFAG